LRSERSGRVESQLLASGEAVRLRLELPPGVYKIECFVDGHDDRGTESLLEVRAGAPLIEKKAAAGTQNAVAISGFAFRPAELTVQAGQPVTWANEDPAEHTVTEQNNAVTSKTLTRGGRSDRVRPARNLPLPPRPPPGDERNGRRRGVSPVK
jgi:plastocyanin